MPRELIMGDFQQLRRDSIILRICDGERDYGIAAQRADAFHSDGSWYSRMARKNASAI